MAKNKRNSSKQSVSSAKPRNYSAMYKDDTTIPQAQGASSTGDGAPVVEKKGSDQVDWKGEYSYVFSDLRTLTIVSAVLFAVIIGVGFIL